MKILVIDDERTFNFDCVYARSFTEAAFELFNGKSWDGVWLDHDLGDIHDGNDLATIIEANGFNGDILQVKEFIIHSSNPVGREKMRQALSRFYSVRMVRAEDYQ